MGVRNYARSKLSAQQKADDAESDTGWSMRVHTNEASSVSNDAELRE